MPRISIITPSFNRADMIAGAIESVLDQSSPDFEHIIVDGGSTDDTLHVLERYPHLKVIAGPDHGMYDALNKGLAVATGAVIGFLNTDDVYAPQAFANILPGFDDPARMAVVGAAVIYKLDAKHNKQVVAEFHPEQTTLIDSVTIGSPYFNGWFFRAQVFEKIGKFNPRYRVVADREFMLRFALSALPYKIIAGTVYLYQSHPGALTFMVNEAKFRQIVDEHLDMIDNYRRAEIPAEVRRKLLASCTRDTIEMFLLSLKGSNLRMSLTYMLAGLQRDLFWGMHLLAHLVGKLGR